MGDIVSALMPTVLYLTALKNSDPRSFNLANIAQRRDMLAKLSNESLERELQDGNELSWKQKPSWYHALIAEIRSRDMIPSGYGSIVDMFDH